MQRTLVSMWLRARNYFVGGMDFCGAWKGMMEDKKKKWFRWFREYFFVEIADIHHTVYDCENCLETYQPEQCFAWLWSSKNSLQKAFKLCHSILCDISTDQDFKRVPNRHNKTKSRDQMCSSFFSQNKQLSGFKSICSAKSKQIQTGATLKVL